MNQQLNELHLFAGAGGGILGGILCGHTTVCAVEIEPHCRKVLLQRQRDGILPKFPIWDDVQTFDGNPWRGKVDIVCGGFPCQDISSAGKGAGIEGSRSSMWKHMARVIGEVRPRYAFVENSPMLVGRGLAVVLGDLAEMGYDAQWGVLGANHAGAPHKRERIWIVAHSNGAGLQDGWAESNRRMARSDEGREAASDHLSTPAESSRGAVMANADMPRREEQRCAVADGAEHETAECGGWWTTEPDVGRMAHGVAARVDRLRCIGNGQVPAVVPLAWQILSGNAQQKTIDKSTKTKKDEKSYLQRVKCELF